MEDFMDLIVNDEPPSQISDAIKNMLYTKASEFVDSHKPEVALSMFDNLIDSGDEIDDEIDEE
jgi:hypothetical protein